MQGAPLVWAPALPLAGTDEGAEMRPRGNFFPKGGVAGGPFLQPRSPVLSAHKGSDSGHQASRSLREVTSVTLGGHFPAGSARDQDWSLAQLLPAPMCFPFVSDVRAQAAADNRPRFQVTSPTETSEQPVMGCDADRQSNTTGKPHLLAAGTHSRCSQRLTILTHYLQMHLQLMTEVCGASTP